MGRLIDADALVKKLLDLCKANGCDEPFCVEDGCVGCDVFEGVTIVKNAPTIDAVHVVRCKDCVLRGGMDCPMRCLKTVNWECEGHTGCMSVPIDLTTDDGFCHMGRINDV